MVELSKTSDMQSVKQFESLLIFKGRRRGLVVERRTPEREVGGSILTQVAVLCP